MDTDRLMEFLTREGFRPSLAAEGDVRFKYEGGHYAVRFVANDPQWVLVSYPNFWQIGSPEEELRALRAAGETSQVTKIVKIHVVAQQHNVWAEAELLIERPEQFEALFPRTLSILRSGVAKFVELMKKSEPLPDKRIELRREEVTRWMHGN
jgi:hypothetical protein